MTLEYTIGSDEFMSDLDGMDALINEEVLSQEKEYFWEELYQGLPDSPDMDDAVDQEYSEKDFHTYDKFFGAEVCLPDKQGIKTMERVTKRVKDKNVNTRGIEHSTLFIYHSL